MISGELCRVNPGRGREHLQINKIDYYLNRKKEKKCWRRTGERRKRTHPNTSWAPSGRLKVTLGPLGCYLGVSGTTLGCLGPPFSFLRPPFGRLENHLSSLWAVLGSLWGHPDPKVGKWGGGIGFWGGRLEGSGSISG